MTAILVRVGVLALVSLALWLVVWGGRRYVESRRQAVLRAAPAALPSGPGLTGSAEITPVQILNFSSADCSQCFKLQAPALRRLLEARSGDVTIVNVDAPNTPDLAERYQVMTVPTTVVLDASGQAQAVNFGFAPTERLLAQVDAVLAKGDQVAASPSA